MTPATGAQEPHFLHGVEVSLFDGSDDCVKILELDGRLVAMNANGLCTMEIDDFDTLRGQPWPSLWPEPLRATVEAAMEQARGGGMARFSAECPTAKGTPKSWEVAVWPINADGLPQRLVSVSRDVTEQKRMEEEMSLFARELGHRIKNMFAVVDGVIAMSARSTPEAADFADDLRRRLRSLGNAIA